MQSRDIHADTEGMASAWAWLRLQETEAGMFAPSVPPYIALSEIAMTKGEEKERGMERRQSVYRGGKEVDQPATLKMKG